MENVNTRPLSTIDKPTWRSWLPRGLSLALVLAAMVVYLALPFLALRWFQAPFIGAFVGKGLIFEGAAPTGDPGAWSAYQLGLRLETVKGKTLYSRLQAIDEQAVFSEEDMSAALEGFQPGDTVSLQVGTSEGQVVTQQVRLSRFPIGDQISYFFAPYLIGLVYLGTAGWVLARHHRRELAGLFVLFFTSVGLATGMAFDQYTTRGLAWLWPPVTLTAGAAAAALLLIFGRLALRHQKPAFFNNSGQARWAGLAALASYLPIATWGAAKTVSASWLFHPFLFLPLLIFPLAFWYALQRPHIQYQDRVMRTGMQYALLTVIVAAGYALIVAGLGLGAGQLFPGNSSFLTGVLFFLLALAFIPLREKTQSMVDAVFFRGRHAFQERMQTFSGEITRAVGLPGILSTLRRAVDDTFAPSRQHIFIYDSLSDRYLAVPDGSGKPTSDLHFPTYSGLAIRMSNQLAPLMLSDREPFPPTLEPDRARLILLGAQVFIPLPGRQRLSGWLALGPRLSGEPYTATQLEFIVALCDQTALAIERAQVIENMEKRMREMNLLTRVSQGINVTLSLDDILELVYAQTTQIIPAHSFRIMLYVPGKDVYQYAFYLLGEDRVAEKENTPVAAGEALEQEIIRQRKAILTDNYNHECQQRGIYIPPEELFAWMGVPLNAGAETIGALSMGSVDQGLVYTTEQRSLLQAIADQMAGALVKARLLQESERRTRQLASLNEVTRKLTSTLETGPLLQSILESAVEILNCEAGSLLMVDSATDELVFEATVGPVATRLAKQRMPAGQGAVGVAVRTGEPVIVNDVTYYPEWFSEKDEQTGFHTRALMAVPLKVKEQVIGVIEVLNKQDGSFFSGDDQDLLSGFAAQAVVAIENARLYTLTDQALATRVEELSVMQRIDRELNTSLDTNTAMRITLEWAMRQSRANAGFVAVLKGDTTNEVQVMASHGYATELERYSEQPLPAEEYGLKEAIEGGISIRRMVDGRDGSKSLLVGGKSQAILPIRRETTTIGLLLLESYVNDPVSDDVMGFLSRLVDHASIAISNAQLYTAVQQANLAKSDFVSFVTHELKNPMTSVKGYTELISAGVVGPVTDVQANFLSTIHHNIERMNTLISDLNDMAKIEVGRLRLDFKSIEIKEIIESVVRSTRKQIEEKQQTLVLNIPTDLAPVWADRTRIEQVLVNLVSNAHKYTPASGVIEVSAEYSANLWDSSGAAHVIHLWVKDNGIGISEEDRNRIFQKFFRSEDPKTREASGSGLGLHITRSLVELQGGRIWFESEFRKGTTFHFTIPVSET